MRRGRGNATQATEIYAYSSGENAGVTRNLSREISQLYIKPELVYRGEGRSRGGYGGRVKRHLIKNKGLTKKSRRHSALRAQGGSFGGSDAGIPVDRRFKPIRPFIWGGKKVLDKAEDLRDSKTKRQKRYFLRGGNQVRLSSGEGNSWGPNYSKKKSSNRVRGVLSDKLGRRRRSLIKNWGGRKKRHHRTVKHGTSM